MKIIIESDIMMARLDDEAALLNMKSGKYFSLNATGVRVWELLEKSNETEEILAAMLKEYDVDQDILRQDLNQLVSRLTEAGLVKVIS